MHLSVKTWNPNFENLLRQNVFKDIKRNAKITHFFRVKDFPFHILKAQSLGFLYLWFGMLKLKSMTLSLSSLLWSFIKRKLFNQFEKIHLCSTVDDDGLLNVSPSVDIFYAV